MNSYLDIAMTSRATFPIEYYSIATKGLVFYAE